MIVSTVLRSASGGSVRPPRRGRRPGDGGTSVIPGPPLGGQDVVHTRRGAEARRRVQGTRDEVHDAAERQPTREEGRDRLLVGRVEQGGDDAAGLPGLPG